MGRGAVGLCVVTGLLLMAACVAGQEKDSEKKPPIIVATDYATVNAAVDAARKLNVNRIYIPAGEYEITKTINMTGRYGIRGALILEGAGVTTILNGKTGGKPIIDLSGSAYCQVNNMYIKNVDANIGILMARNKGGAGGGGNSFHDIDLHGPFSIAAVYSCCGEVNRYFNCSIVNTYTGETNGDAFIFTQYNIHKIKSPYIGEIGQSTNTEVAFFGCIIGSYGPASAGVRIVGGADNISIFGGYHHFNGFAAFYFDGSQGAVSNVNIDGLRIETSKGKHCIYATGRVDNVTVRGGEWSSKEELIRAEDVIPNTEGAHATVTKKDRRYGIPYNWRIREITLLRTIWSPEDKKEEIRAKAPKFVAMRFDSLEESTIENITFRANFLEQEGGNWLSRPADKYSLVAIDKFSRRNSFVVESKDMVELSGDASANRIVALHDLQNPEDKSVPFWQNALPEKEHWEKNSFMYNVNQHRQLPAGIRRDYVQADKGISLLNLGTIDVRTIKGARAGDIAIHNGAGFADGKARLAVFDGKEWMYFAEDSKPEEQDN